MEIFHVISVAVPVLIAAGLPRVMRRYLAPKAEARYRPLLYAACVLFAVSWYLPSPLIDGQDTAFVKHFVGGGMFSGLLWIYLKQTLGWRAPWRLEAASLFALVSALGCINELAELFMVRAGIAQILLSDTNWDILANTLGALVVYVLYINFRSKP